MNRWKVALFATIGLLILSNVYWIYLLIDSGVSYTYLHSSYEARDRAVRDLGQLIVKGSSGYTRKDMLHLLRQARPDAFIVDEADAIDFEGIKFRFKEDRLVEVESTL